MLLFELNRWALNKDQKGLIWLEGVFDRDFFIRCRFSFFFS